jgi:two-component system, chemotaxis family, response regulator Rcp1
MTYAGQKSELLLVEDNSGDVELIRLAFHAATIINPLHVVGDGEQAIAYLRRHPPFDDAQRPGLILLDLNLPRLNGHDVLRILKSDFDLKHIPVCVLTTSHDEGDVLQCYSLQANSYIPKPDTFPELINLAHKIKDYWLTIAILPS